MKLFETIQQTLDDHESDELADARERIAALEEVLLEVLTISDRKHDAWVRGWSLLTTSRLAPEPE